MNDFYSKPLFLSLKNMRTFLFIIILIAHWPQMAQAQSLNLANAKLDTIKNGDPYQVFIAPYNVLDINSAYRYYTEAGFHYQKGNLTNASVLMDKAIKKQPENADYRVLQSYILTEYGDYKRAINHAEKAVSLQPENWKVLYCLALARYASGDYLGANIEYSKAINLDASAFQLYEGRAHARSELKDHNGAFEDYSTTIMLKPAYLKAYYFRAVEAYKLGKYNEAIVDLSSVLVREQENGQAYYYRGLCRRMLGDFIQSCSDFEKASKYGVQEATDEVKKNCTR
jgi:tetratricopeptide (TPR) repeat protein